MSDNKTEDRHVEPPMQSYPLRVEVETIRHFRRLSKDKQRTRQSLMREALRVFVGLPRKGA